MALLGGLIYLWLRSYELTVTDKRVYGKVQFGKRVDLPVDSVSATATIQLLKGVSVSTSSGKISFLAIKNANEIYSTINNLLIERQQKKESVVTKVEAKVDETEQLTKYKELLDKGVITQEEFDAKKKQLLGL
ncbi:MAG: SHOCT domain-containing protein [Clostridia bacterium]|nr:SHOCT domain-containing protein [Clostridia bacterium]